MFTQLTLGKTDLAVGGIVDRFLDQGDSFQERGCRYRYDLVIESTIRLLVNPLKSHRVFGRDPARVGLANKVQTLNKKHSLLVDFVLLDPLDFSGECRRDRIAEIAGQRIRADRRTIEELLLVVAEARGAQLALALQVDDRIDKRSMRPGFRDALRLPRAIMSVAASSTTL